MSLEVEDLVAGYRDSVVLRGITTRFAEGELVAVIGPNGSGKTTLLRCLAGLLKPIKGVVRYDGRDISRMPHRDRSKIVGYLPQTTPLIFPITVQELVLLGRIPHFNVVPRKTDRDIAVSVLKELDLLDKAERRIDELSGGERQRAYLARLLAQDPKILVLDEPESSLDLRYQIELLEKIRDITKRRRKITVMSIHDLNLALKFADRIIALNSGRVVVEGNPLEVLDEKTISKIYGVEGVELVKTSRGLRVVV